MNWAHIFIVVFFVKSFAYGIVKHNTFIIPYCHSSLDTYCDLLCP